MHPIEIGLSFLEGVALIVSPCILPVLPLVLSASIEGGRKRPFGIILGFVIAFTVFALLSRHLVSVLHIDLGVIKYGSLVLLALFGIILLSETLSLRFSAFAQRFAGVGSNLTVGMEDGFLSGIFVGMLIGVIWTPCAGPILAAVLVQVIRQENGFYALFLVAAFALGAGLPMLVISLTGRKLLIRFNFLVHYGHVIRKVLGAIIVLAVLFIASGAEIRPKVMDDAIPANTTPQQLVHALPNPYIAPEFSGVEAWLNSQPLTMQGLKGKVVLVDFWTYSCINCIRTLPYITAWDKQYRDKGLVIVGVHAPEFEFEKEKANVENALSTHRITYPVALDNHLDTWTNFKNRYWPAHYLVDKEGKVVYTHFGEGAYHITENNIRFLLGLHTAKAEQPEIPVISMEQTPETYLGSERAMRFNSPEKLLLHEVQGFHFPEGGVPGHHWALQGQWQVEGQHITAAETGAKLYMHFTAGKVFLVLGTRDRKPVTAHVLLNGVEVGPHAGNNVSAGKVTVRQHTLYELINQGKVQDGILEITAEAPGLEAYAFTFGN